jgi:hypothetical protein
LRRDVRGGDIRSVMCLERNSVPGQWPWLVHARPCIRRDCVA